MLIGVGGEERDMLQCHTVVALQEDAQLALLQIDGRGECNGVLRPLGRGDVDGLLCHLLLLAHGVLVDKLYADGTIALRSLGPYGEAIGGTLLETDAKETLVGESRAAIVMVGSREHHIVRTALEGAIVLQFYTSESLPAHQCLWELERTVLDELAIQTTIGGIVDVFEEYTIHGRSDGGTQLARIHLHGVLCIE